MADLERYDRATRWAHRRQAEKGRRSRLVTAVNVVRNMVEDRVAGLAAEMAFWALLSIVPLLVSIAALMGYAESLVGAERLEGGRAVVVEAVSVIFSRELTVDVVDPFVRGMLTEPRGGIAITSLLVGLYLASRVFTATIRALDLAYRVPERRGAVAQRILAMALAVGFVVVAVATIIVVVVGPLLGGGQVLAEQLGADTPFRLAWSVGRWIVLFGVTVWFLAAVYRYGPNVENTWRESLPGALLAVATWTSASLALRLYLAAGGGGTPAISTEDQAVALVARVVGAVVAVLLWMFVTGFAILAGGELNAELARRAD